MVELLQLVQDCLYFALSWFKYCVLRHSFFLVKTHLHKQFRTVHTPLIFLLHSPTLPGEVFRLITVETNNFSSLSSIIAAPGLGLSTVSLQAVSLQMSWFVTTVAIPQVVRLSSHSLVSVTSIFGVG